MQIASHNNVFIDSNIPINTPPFLRAKEVVHDFFRRPAVVRFFTYLPSMRPLQKYKTLAQLITRCHQVFEGLSHVSVKVYGGDRLTTLQKLEKSRLLEKSLEYKGRETQIKFSLKDSLQAARDLKAIANPNQKIAILNLANRQQAGGVGLAPYGGSQEEYLVRRSNLAWGLDSRFACEQAHHQLSQIRKEEKLFEPFQHHIPYFGAVVSRNVEFIDQEQPDYFDVISAAAPDMRKGSDEYSYLQKLFSTNRKAAQHQILKDKIRAIFEAALAENIENLVLGAFGCGCFQNDTQEVATIFSELLQSDSYKNQFHRITFAITEKSKLAIFQKYILGN